MGRYSEPIHWLGFIHRDVMVDVYRRKKGSSCCELPHDLNETVCLNCDSPIEPEDIYQICIAGIFIPGADSPDESDAMEMAMYIIDERPGALFNPEEYMMARFEIETDGDEEEDEGWREDPLPGSIGDIFNQALSIGKPEKDSGKSDLLGDDRPDRITNELIESALIAAPVSIVPVRQTAPPGGAPLRDAARLAAIARQMKQLKWGAKALKIVKTAREKK